MCFYFKNLSPELAGKLQPNLVKSSMHEGNSNSGPDLPQREIIAKK
jgi:hypothetical protein